VARAGVPEPVVALARDARRVLRRAAARGVDASWPPSGAAPDPAAGVRLLVGGANFAGQAWAWARTAERLDGVSARAFTVRRGGFPFRTDVDVAVARLADPRWQRAQERWVLGSFTHALVESFRPLLGDAHGSDCRGDLAVLRAGGLDLALVAHGSDVRQPSLHGSTYAGSPFRGAGAEGEYVATLERQAARNRATAARFDGPVFVSTPDLLDFVPRATWLPTVLDLAPWERAASERGVLEGDRPLVLHVPTNPRLKGTAEIDAAMQHLHAEGLVEYRRVQGVAPDDMPALVASADVVVDQVALGLYSLTAVEAMAAGRLVVAHVPEHVRARTPVPLPVLEADGATLADVVRAALADRDPARARAAEGPAYARAVHDGTRSAEVLAGWLSGP
jgi:hypothetical protein